MAENGLHRLTSPPPFRDGEISANAAAGLTERIAAGEAHLGLGWLDGGHRGGPGGRDGVLGDRGDGRRGGDEQSEDATDDLDGVGGGDTDETQELVPGGTPVVVN